MNRFVTLYLARQGTGGDPSLPGSSLSLPPFFLLYDLCLHAKLFRELKPGTRIVSHEFDMEDWKPDNMGTVRNVKLFYRPNPTVKDTHYYYWVIPADVAGIWRWSLSTSTGMRDYVLRLAQQFQEISGEVNIRGQKIPIIDARLVGTQLSFTLRDNTDKQNVVMRFNGRISSDTIEGNVEVEGGPFAGGYSWTARRTHLSLHQPAR